MTLCRTTFSLLALTSTLVVFVIRSLDVFAPKLTCRCFLLKVIFRQPLNLPPAGTTLILEQLEPGCDQGVQVFTGEVRKEAIC